MHGTADPRKGRRFLRDGDAAGMCRVRLDVQLTEKIDGLQVLPPAVPVGDPVAGPPRIIQVQH